MVRVTIELLPMGSESNKRLLGVAEISNDGLGTAELGDYTYMLSKFNQPAQVWKRGGIQGFKRKKLGPWDLLFRVLKDAVGGRE